MQISTLEITTLTLYYDTAGEPLVPHGPYRLKLVSSRSARRSSANSISRSINCE